MRFITFCKWFFVTASVATVVWDAWPLTAKSMRGVLWWTFALFLAVLLTLETFVLLDKVPGNTISEITQTASRRWPVIPAILCATFGMLVPHFWCPKGCGLWDSPAVLAWPVLLTAMALGYFVWRF